MKVDLQYFGGRGASSTRKKSHNIGDAVGEKLIGSRFNEEAFPRLEGTPKQVKYANDIRNKVYRMYKGWHKTAITKSENKYEDYVKKVSPKVRDAFDKITYGSTMTGLVRFQESKLSGISNFPVPSRDVEFAQVGSKNWLKNAQSYLGGHNTPAQDKAYREYLNRIDKNYMHSNGIGSAKVKTKADSSRYWKTVQGNLARFFNDEVKRAFKTKTSASDWINYWKGNF